MPPPRARRPRPESPPSPPTEVHLKPVWNSLDQPVWIIASVRYSVISRAVSESPVFTRLWKADWGWEIDHSEYKELIERFAKMNHIPCPQCSTGGACDLVEWKLWKIGVRPRRADEKRAPKDQRYQYARPAWDESRYDEFGNPFAPPPPAAGMSPSEAAGVLGLAWPLDRVGAGAAIKEAFKKAALATHADTTGAIDNKPMVRLIDARTVLNNWLGE